MKMTRTRVPIRETALAYEALKPVLSKIQGKDLWEYAKDHSDETVAKQIGMKPEHVREVRLTLFGRLSPGSEVGAANMIGGRIRRLEEAVAAMGKEIGTLSQELAKLRGETSSGNGGAPSVLTFPSVTGGTA